MAHRAFPPTDVQQQLGVQCYAYLGGGAFRSVFAARYLKTSEEVAVAVERLGEEQQKDFAVMARIESTPRHPHLIGPPSSAPDGAVPRLIVRDRCYSVLERCSSELFDCITNGSLREAAAREFFVQAVAGLRWMHECGVAHRDIKLENILLTANGTLKIIDFGLSHVSPMPIASSAPWDMRDTQKVGTKSYVPPEVGTGHLYDARACDVWSLGCTLFALVTGFFIVEKANASDPRFVAMDRAQRAGRSSVRAIFALYSRPCILSGDLVSLLDGMLTIAPEQRWSTEQVIVCPWLASAYEPFHRREALYENTFVAERRLADNGAPAATSTLSMSAIDVTDNDAPEPPPTGTWLASDSAGSCDGYEDDDEMGPPVWRSGSASPVKTAADPLQDLAPGPLESLLPPGPPLIVRQHAEVQGREPAMLAKSAFS